MKNFRKLIYLISIAMLVLGFLYVAPPATASDILVTPIGQTIRTPPNTNFSLNFKMIFNQNDDGYFSVTFYWDNNETSPEPEKWNFTYQNFSLKFTDGTPFSGSIKVSILKRVPGDYPSGYYRYTVTISETYGESYGTPPPNHKEFWLNITMRNAGLKNGTYYPHAIGDQNITISKVRCYESAKIVSGPGTVTIRSEIDDVAVTNVKAVCQKEGLNLVTEGYHSWTVNVTVTVKNKGNFTESFTVYAFYGNATGNYTIGSASVENLAVGIETTKTIAWNLANAKWCNNYVIYANTSVIVGDVDLSNNCKKDGNLKVKHDADANNDNWVDIDDQQILGWSWQKGVGDPGYDARADFSFDAFVDVDDLQILSWNWQQGC